MLLLTLAAPLVPQTCFSEESAGKPIITILDFQLSNVSKEEGAVIVDFLMSYLVETRVYRVIDRKERAAILEEIEFAVSDCTDEGCQLRLGQLISANQIIVGSIGRVEERCILNVKLLDVQSGETIRTASEKYKSMNMLVDDSQRLILEFVKGASAGGEAVVIYRKTGDELAAVPEMEMASRKERLMTLLNQEAYRKPETLQEMQDLSTYFYDFERPMLYKQYASHGAVFAALGNTLFGLGSWLQGDYLGGVVVSGMMIGGFALILGAGEESGATLISLGAIFGWTEPFVFQSSSNKKLRKSLLLE